LEKGSPDNLEYDRAKIIEGNHPLSGVIPAHIIERAYITMEKNYQEIKTKCK